MEVTGGPTQKLCDAQGGSDGSWSWQGNILFDGTAPSRSTGCRPPGGRRRSRSNRTRRGRSGPWHGRSSSRRPPLSLDGDGEKAEDSANRVGLLDSTQTKLSVAAQTLVTYAPPGYLLFVAIRLSSPSRSMRTPGKRTASRSRSRSISARTAWASRRSRSRAMETSRTGPSSWRPDPLGRPFRQGGRRRRRPGRLPEPRSPDGDRLAFDLADPRSGKPDIWVRDLRRGVSSRPPSGPATRSAPRGRRTGADRVHRGRRPLREGRRRTRRGEDPSEVGRAEILLRLVPRRAIPGLLQPSEGDGLGHLGRSHARRPQTDAVPQDPVPEPYHVLPGRPVRRLSVERVRRGEVYVQSFPGPGGKWQISTAGGLSRTGGPMAGKSITALRARSSWLSRSRRAACSRPARQKRFFGAIRMGSRSHAPSPCGGRQASAWFRAARTRRDDAHDRRLNGNADLGTVTCTLVPWHPPRCVRNPQRARSGGMGEVYRAKEHGSAVMSR